MVYEFIGWFVLYLPHTHTTQRGNTEGSDYNVALMFY